MKNKLFFYDLLDFYLPYYIFYNFFNIFKFDFTNVWRSVQNYTNVCIDVRWTFYCNKLILALLKAGQYLLSLTNFLTGAFKLSTYKHNMVQDCSIHFQLYILLIEIVEDIHNDEFHNYIDKLNQHLFHLNIFFHHVDFRYF